MKTTALARKAAALAKALEVGENAATDKGLHSATVRANKLAQELSADAEQRRGDIQALIAALEVELDEVAGIKAEADRQAARTAWAGK